jgi:uncharacterized protein YjbI with pentapeptide repeats/beta-lactamase regulating signal transducer with metallopeptidase domain
MLEAVVGVALRAILASVLLGGVLATLVLVATRALALTAATRHALWTSALIATGVMPFAGIGVSVARAYAVPPPSFATHATPADTNVAAAPNTATVPQNAGGATHDGAAVRHSDVTQTTWTASRTTSSDVAKADTKPSPAGRFSFAAWTPRVTRELARGVVAVWAFGALIGLFGLAASIVRVRGLKRRSSPLDGTLADELPWLTAADAKREIYLRLSYETETPVAIGFRRPVILIPTELATADGLAAIESLILHEHAHLRRFDDWTNLVQRTIERVFWFNPIVWLVGRRIALEREIASDDAVVEKTGEAHAYATSLWKLAREMRMPEHAVVAPGALLTRKQITVRIEQLLDKKRARLHRSPAAALGVALAGILAVTFVATSAPAVELPAEAASTPAEAEHVAARAHQPSTTVKHVDAKTLAVRAPAPKPLARPAAEAKTRTIVRYQYVKDERPVRDRVAYVITPRKAPSSPHGRSPDADHGTWSGPAWGSGFTPSDADSGAAPPVTHEPPAPPAPRGAGTVPAVPPMPAISIHSMPPQAAAALRAATRAAAQVAAAEVAARTREVTSGIGPEVAKQIHDAMAALPREIAQESSTPTSRRAPSDGAKLTRELIASCTGCSFRNRDMRGLDLHDVRMSGNDFSGADLRGANLSGAQLSGVSLRRANLAGADLRGASLNGVELAGANFENALLDNIRLTGVSLQNVTLRGTTLRSVIASCTGCDFSHLDLRGQDLHGITLNGADMSRADLRDANLSGVHFSGVDLSYANLGGADLSNARLDGCDLAHVNWSGARITGMKMTGSGLDG